MKKTGNGSVWKKWSPGACLDAVMSQDRCAKCDGDDHRECRTVRTGAAPSASRPGQARGSHQSYCIFISASKSKETKERLEILNKSNDGFFIASEDLETSRSGRCFGIRQSGTLILVWQTSFRLRLLQRANEAAEELS